jgi:hypothetical protein
MPIILFLVVCTENLPKSVVIHFLPSFSATAAVVPEPQKKSAIKSPSLDEAFRILSNKASGFWVAYPTFSSATGFTGGISSQTLSTISPSISSR